MFDYINYLLFGLYPYFAISVCIVACIARLEFSPYTWKTGSSQFLSSKGLRLGSNLFHVGIILLLLGHFVGLLTPESLYTHVISVPHKQLMAMIAGGTFGSLCFVGLTILVYRRLFNPRVRATSSFSDILILLLLYLQLILGLISIWFSSNHLDGKMMEALANWAQSIVIFHRGAADYLLQVSPIFRLHIFLGLTIVLLIPFTRLVHLLSVPYEYFIRTGYQVVKRRKKS
jgi:nitrate reductase gamma subunit